MAWATLGADAGAQGGRRVLGDRGMASPAGAQGPSTDVCVEPARARIPTSDQQGERTGNKIPARLLGQPRICFPQFHFAFDDDVELQGLGRYACQSL